ncbi:MAG: hypothetical protein KDB22_28470 [Planctomycetales bacterium]|nr:hypothetical protein [Planctomycetales bacterium]
MKRLSARQIEIEASETSGAGDKVLRMDRIAVESLTNEVGEPTRFSTRDCKIQFEKSSPEGPSGLKLSIVLDTPLSTRLGSLDGIAQFTVGTIVETILPLSTDSNGTLSHPDLVDAKVTASARSIVNLGVFLSGADAGKIKQARLLTGEAKHSPQRETRSGNSRKFGWEKLESLPVDAVVEIWASSDANQPADWSFMPAKSATLKHPSLDIQGSVSQFPQMDIQLTGAKANLISAGVFDKSGQPVGSRPYVQVLGDQQTISITTEGQDLKLHIRTSADPATSIQSIRLNDLPIQD